MPPMEEKLGKITSAYFGQYNGRIGLVLEFESQGFGVGDFKGYWGGKRSDHCKWSELDRITALGEVALFIDKTLTEAKKQSVEKLVGTPVMLTFNSNILHSWRVLTEVL